jgi:hypothetical protein
MTISTAEAEDFFSKVATGLAELGWRRDHDYRLVVEEGRMKCQVNRLSDKKIPPAVIYMASYLTGEQVACWACWHESIQSDDHTIGYACFSGDCRHPEGPALPPRELLVRT